MTIQRITGGDVATSGPHGKRVAVFDFDGTIVSKDTAFCFILYLLTASRTRMFLAAVAMPLFLPLFYPISTRSIAISMLLWIGTFGLSETRTDDLFDKFTNSYFSERFKARFFGKALEEIQRRREMGDEILIISGTPERLVKHIASQFIQGDLTVIGTRYRKFLGGLVYTRYCLGENKISLAKESGLDLDTWHHGYSDSPSDIPLLSRCKVPCLINPDRKTIRRVNKALPIRCRPLYWS